MQLSKSSVVKTVGLNEYGLFLPANLDMEKLLSTNPPPRLVSQDGLEYLISLILRKGLQYKEDYFPNKKTGFIPLKAKYLKAVIHDYKLHITYLIENGILECDRHYEPGISSIGYRLSIEYKTHGFIKKTISKGWLFFKLRNVFHEEIENQNYWRQKRRYLFTPFYNGSIIIDESKALAKLKELKQIEREKILADNDTIARKREKLECLEHTYSNQIMIITNIINNDYDGSLLVDNTSNRFHSPITRMKKELRQYITIDNIETTMIDLKNSQPYFLLLFFNNLFWRKQKRGGIINLREVNTKYWEYLNIKLPKIHPYMIPRSDKSIENIDISTFKFCSAIRNGLFYEYFMDGYPNKKGKSHKEIRTLVKKEVISFLYDANRDERFLYGIRKKFKLDFPLVYQLLRVAKSYQTGEVRKITFGKPIKKLGDDGEIMVIKNKVEVDAGFTQLVITLQKIESITFLDIICKEISQTYPELNYITIHDSIMVPKSYATKVNNIAFNCLLHSTGEKPILALE